LATSPPCVAARRKLPRKPVPPYGLSFQSGSPKTPHGGLGRFLLQPPAFGKRFSARRLPRVPSPAFPISRLGGDCPYQLEPTYPCKLQLADGTRPRRDQKPTGWASKRAPYHRIVGSTHWLPAFWSELGVPRFVSPASCGNRPRSRPRPGPEFMGKRARPQPSGPSGWAGGSWEPDRPTPAWAFPITVPWVRPSDGPPEGRNGSTGAPLPLGPGHRRATVGPVPLERVFNQHRSPPARAGPRLARPTSKGTRPIATGR